jgi:hypothetical protein
MALLTAWWFERAHEEGVFKNVRQDFTWAAWSLIGVGIVMAIGLGVAATRLLPGETILAALGLVPMLGGIALLWALKHRGLVAARRSFVISGLAFIVTLFVWAAPRISRHQEGSYLAQEIQRHQSQPAVVATYNYFPVGLVFYARRPIDRCRVAAEIPEVLAKPQGLLITRADRLEELKPYLPPGTEILARRQRFLRQHDIVVLGQKQRSLIMPEQPKTSRKSWVRNARFEVAHQTAAKPWRGLFIEEGRFGRTHSR